MLFNLTTRRLFKCDKPDIALGCYVERGPYFGGGELATEEEFNGDK
jgi:hypothetical protein